MTVYDYRSDAELRFRRAQIKRVLGMPDCMKRAALETELREIEVEISHRQHYSSGGAGPYHCWGAVGA